MVDVFASLFQLAGLAALVAAAFLVSIVLGLVAAGLASLVVGIALDSQVTVHRKGDE